MSHLNRGSGYSKLFQRCRYDPNRIRTQRSHYSADARSGGGRRSRPRGNSRAGCDRRSGHPPQSSSRISRYRYRPKLRTKVNANIGASNFHQLIEEEVEKLYTAVRYGADSVMDLSTGTDLDRIRSEILSRCSALSRHRSDLPGGLRAFDHGPRNAPFLEVIERQARQGVDYMTLHCGVTRESVSKLRGHSRIEGIV